ncbi:DUF4136 domain-containing protein [Sphingomonas sp. MG17]|uniref:DUF4136 domain-containing protein n=1 Tax=Sphingomonas tagetis TaxID=2949092 RepID=A0A9X2KMG7_9SPHN|nr:DUF4136 domain-containing protein [Sphingomonas tagetis]MCP3731682.1 DUF4136 domain-containing protein [Sphingomonas tagetis]
MKTRALLALAATAALVAGCSTTTSRTAPVDVVRYHLSQPIPAGTVALAPQSPAQGGPEYALYSGAVGAEMARLGFAQAADATRADYIATVGFSRTDRGQVRTRPPVTIGIGGGSYGGGVGLGGGASFGIGSKTRTVYASELTVQLRRRGDNTMIWEGRALAETLEGQPGAQPVDGAARMAAALFKGFPGQSGITIQVK